MDLNYRKGIINAVGGEQWLCCEKNFLTAVVFCISDTGRPASIGGGEQIRISGGIRNGSYLLTGNQSQGNREKY